MDLTNKHRLGADLLPKNWTNQWGPIRCVFNA